MKKLAIITTHPIQYNAPFFKLLTERGKVYPKVFYTWPQAIDGFDDPDFGKRVKWDIPLLEGYDWEAVENISKDPSSKTWSGIDCPGLNQRIKDFRPDAVFIYGWNLKSHFKAMRYFKGQLPVWFFGDSTLLDEEPGPKRIIRRLWLKFVYRYIDKAFFVGVQNKEYFLAHDLQERQLEFFPHAVENERFQDNGARKYESKAKSWRSKLGFIENNIVILFAGKLEPKKNPMLLLNSVIEINKTGKALNHPINLLFVGNGPLERELKLKAANISYVKFLPFQNQSIMPMVYRLGDIFCLPSQGPGESWGLAVNEAMACNRPVLVSDKVGCARDLVFDPASGRIFRSNSKNDLIERFYSMNQSGLFGINKKVGAMITDWSYSKKCNAIEENIDAI